MTVAKQDYVEINIEESLESSERWVNILHCCWEEKRFSDLVRHLCNMDVVIQSKTKDEKIQIIYFLVKANIVREFEEILTPLHQKGVFKTFDGWGVAEPIYFILWNFTDSSDKFAQSVCESGIIKMIQENLRNSQYREEMDEYEKVRLLMNACLSIVGNILQFEDTIQSMDDDIGDVIGYFTHSNNQEIKLTATLALAYALNDESIAKLNCQASDLVKDMFKSLDLLVEYSMKTKRSGTILIGIGSFSCEEFLACLAKLCINPEIQQVIVDENGLTTLTKFLSSKKSGEVKRAVSCFHRLAFNHNIRRKLQESKPILNKLEYLSSTYPDSEVKKVAKDALWFIGDKESEIKEIKSNQTKSKPALKYDLFMSYSHDNKDNVMKIYDNLKNIHNIWIDQDCLHGDMLVEIPKGINESKIFVLCKSSGYYESDMCKMEAELAWKKKKVIIPVRVEENYRASSWLEFMLINKKYYDLSGAKDFDKEFKNFMADIDKNLK